MGLRCCCISVTTIPTLFIADGPPTDLFGAVMPLLAAFTVGSAALTFMFRRRWSDFAPVLPAVALLMLALGLKVSIMGLVEIPGSSVYVVGNLFGLLVVIALRP